jgi:hypothetical protein
MNPDARLVLLKAVHTTIWVFFASCVVAIPVQAGLGNFHAVVLLIGVVGIEIAVLAMNKWRCPLTPLAARYTSDRRANFDIYLPEWLAGRTMVIFGPLFTGGLVLRGLLWWVSNR